MADRSRRSLLEMPAEESRLPRLMTIKRALVAKLISRALMEKAAKVRNN